MITKRGGILIDWDLSKDINVDGQRLPRRNVRTVGGLHDAVFPTPEISFCQGTWQFMAGDLVKNPAERQTAVHDVESFFWVLMWIIVRRVGTDWNTEESSSFIVNTMDPRVVGNSGGNVKMNWLVSSVSLDGFRIPNNKPLLRLVKKWKKLVGKRYVKKKKSPEQSVDHLIGHKQDKSIHDRMLEAIDCVLGESSDKSNDKSFDESNAKSSSNESSDESSDKYKWPKDDKAISVQLLPPKDMSYCSSRKRSRPLNEYIESESSHKRHH